MNKNDNNIEKLLNNVEFNCQQCSDCCRIDPGIVLLTKEDIDGICKLLGTGEEEFFDKYCKSIYRNSKSYYTLKEKENYDCIFWDEKCTIYEARPLQCKTYPFWPSIVDSKRNWEKEALRCPGINKKGKLTLKEKQKLLIAEKNAVHYESTKEDPDQKVFFSF